MKSTVYSIRLPAQLKERFEAFQREKELTDSQALRMLITLGLAKGEALETGWAKNAMKEAKTKATHDLVKKISGLLEEM